MATIDQIRPTDSCLHVTWDDGVESWYPWLWLRDHAHDEATIHPVTQQRQLDTASLPPDLRAAAATADNGVARITWLGDTEVSEVPVDFLRQFRSPKPARIAAAPQPVLWDGRPSSDAPIRVDYDRVIDSDDGVHQWMATIATYGFAIVTGTPATAEATEALIRRVGYVRETIFGGFWEFTDDLSKADLAYTDAVPAGAHRRHLQPRCARACRCCTASPSTAPAATRRWSTGSRSPRCCASTEPELFDVLSTVAIPGQYIGDGVAPHGRPTGVPPRSQRHPGPGLVQQLAIALRSCCRPTRWLSCTTRCARSITLANSESMQWSQVLRPGEALLFDNWRTLHGRHAYTGKRTMCGAYINHEDFESRLRIGRVSDDDDIERSSTATSPGVSIAAS